MPVPRRAVLAGSAAVAAMPLLGFAVPELRRSAGRTSSQETVRLSASDTPATVSFSIQNNTGADTVYAFVTGQAINNGNALMLLESDGKTPYYPASPSAAGSALAVDCAIPLNASGASPVTITVPQLAGARLWFAIGAPLTFLLNPGPGSSSRPSPTRPTPTSASSGTSLSSRTTPRSCSRTSRRSTSSASQLASP